jgi:hypothetical protein
MATVKYWRNGSGEYIKHDAAYDRDDHCCCTEVTCTVLDGDEANWEVDLIFPTAAAATCHDGHACSLPASAIATWLSGLGHWGWNFGINPGFWGCGNIANDATETGNGAVTLACNEDGTSDIGVVMLGGGEFGSIGWEAIGALGLSFVSCAHDSVGGSCACNPPSLGACTVSFRHV